MRAVFTDEMVRREAVSGTFEVTQGTVVPYVKFHKDDPVTQWHISEHDDDITGKKWHFEYDCNYLRDAMKGLGKSLFIHDQVIHSRIRGSN